MMGVAAWVQRLEVERRAELALVAPGCVNVPREDLLDRERFERVLFDATGVERWYRTALPLPGGWALSGPALVYSEVVKNRAGLQRSWPLPVGIVRVQLEGAPWDCQAWHDDWQERLDARAGTKLAVVAHPPSDWDAMWAERDALASVPA